MKLRSTSAFLGTAVFLAACGSSGIGLTGIQQLGASFLAAFNADGATGEPVDAQDVDLAAVSFTTDPFNP